MKKLCLLLSLLCLCACTGNNPKPDNQLLAGKKGVEGPLIVDTSDSVNHLIKYCSGLLETKLERNPLCAKLNSIGYQNAGPYLWGNSEAGKKYMEEFLSKYGRDKTEFEAVFYTLKKMGIIMLMGDDGQIFFTEFKEQTYFGIPLVLIESVRLSELGAAMFSQYSTIPNWVMINRCSIDNLQSIFNESLIRAKLDKYFIPRDRFCACILAQEIFHFKNPTKGEWAGEIPSVRIGGQFYLLNHIVDAAGASNKENNPIFNNWYSQLSVDYRSMLDCYGQIFNSFSPAYILPDKPVAELISIVLSDNPGILTHMVKSIKQ